MTDLTEILAELIDELTPLHASEARFADGGHKCARAIARIYARLREAESLAHDLEAQVALGENEGRRR